MMGGFARAAHFKEAGMIIKLEGALLLSLGLFLGLVLAWWVIVSFMIH